MKISANVKNCFTSSKMPKNRKNNFGNIFKIFFENQQILLYKCMEMAIIKWLKKEGGKYSYEKLTTNR